MYVCVFGMDVFTAKAEDRYPAALLTRLRAAQVEEIALYAMAKKRFEAHFRLVTGEQSATAQ
jgi:hypothetical protein